MKYLNSLFATGVIPSVSTWLDQLDPCLDLARPMGGLGTLDHFLILAQQVVFQLLELQEVPISPHRLPSHSYKQVTHQRTWALTQVKLTTEPKTSSPSIQEALCIPRSHLHDNWPERQTTLACSLPIGMWIASSKQLWLTLNQSPNLHLWQPANTGDMVQPQDSNSGPLP